MEKSISAKISCRDVNGGSGYIGDFKAERNVGSYGVRITVPAGPRTEKKLSFTIDKNELFRLSHWIQQDHE